MYQGIFIFFYRQNLFNYRGRPVAYSGITMKNYILLLNNSEQINENENLISKCSSWAMIDLLIYKSFSFANCSCYMQTVHEEIEFVIKSQKSCGENVLDQSEFIKSWNLHRYLNTKVTDLSGGWRKYLGLALFTNRNSQGKLYLDSLRHLSDNLIDVFFSNLKRGNNETVIFAEYETKLLCNRNLTPLYDLGDRLSLDIWQDQFIKGNHETNYA